MLKKTKTYACRNAIKNSNTVIAIISTQNNKPKILKTENEVKIAQVKLNKIFNKA
jgi:hypothetical protein